MSEPSSDPPTSLRTLFTHAQSLSTTLASSTTPSNSPSHQSAVSATISAYQSCAAAAARISLFSPNESLDDLSTTDLPYLSISFHLATVLQKDSSKPRLEILRASRSAYEDFLHLLSQYGILSAGDARAFARYQEDKDAFSVVSTSDPAARRDAKIARLKEERGLKGKLEALRRDPEALRNDDEALRELRMAELQLQTHETFQALDFIAQEVRILAQAPRDPGPDPRQLAADHRLRTTGRDGDGDGYSERLDGNVRTMLQNGRGGPILDARGRPLQPFVLMDRRRELREGVFRPGHRLPTMSIDEYLEEERRRGGIIEGGGEPPVVEPDEDDLDKADEEVMKKREWDEYVEANPKGSGNTLNRG